MDTVTAEARSASDYHAPILYLDTETTGLEPATARLVELAVILDHPDRETEYYTTLVRPEGFDIPASATRIHGITTEHAWSGGAALGEVLQVLLGFAQDASGGLLVAHNLRYDLAVLAHELRRLELPLLPLSALRPFCTMLSLTDRCGLPATGGREGFKWPRLSEAWSHCFGEPYTLVGHSASVDVSACRAIFRHGLLHGWWSHA